MAQGPLERIGAGLEWIVYGPYARPYRAFVYLVLLATGALVLANGLVVLEVIAVSEGIATALWTAGSVAVALFALTAIVQLVVLARTFERGTEEVAETAAELETAAAEVEATADELEATAETVETAATEVETAATEVTEAATAAEGPDPDEVQERAAEATDVAETVRSEAAEVKETTETAKETVSEAKQVAESERKRLPADVEGPERKRNEGGS